MFLQRSVRSKSFLRSGHQRPLFWEAVAKYFTRVVDSVEDSGSSASLDLMVAVYHLDDPLGLQVEDHGSCLNGPQARFPGQIVDDSKNRLPVPREGGESLVYDTVLAARVVLVEHGQSRVHVLGKVVIIRIRTPQQFVERAWVRSASCHEGRKCVAVSEKTDATGVVNDSAPKNVHEGPPPAQMGRLTRRRDQRNIGLRKVSTQPISPPARALTPAQTLVALFLLVVTVFAQSCGSGGSGPTPTPPPPAVSPVPRDVSVDLVLANRLYIAGETDRALEIYYAAVARGSAVDRQAAIWQVSRIQYERGEHSTASQNARAFLGTTPGPEQQRQALLLLGYSEAAQGRNESAMDAFQAYVETGGPAAPYAGLQLAEIAARRGDSDDAIELATAAMVADLPRAAGTAGLFALARYQEAADDRTAALASYEELAADGELQSDRAEALWNLAAVARELRDEVREQEALHDLIVSYPWHDRALEALNSAAPATAADRAYVLFRHRANEDATAAYQALVTDADLVVSGESHYYLGILAERAGDPGQALNEYSAAIAALSGTSSSLLGDAHWDRGLVFESTGRLSDAAQDFAIIAELAPGHARAAEGLFRAGLIRYRQGLLAETVTLWNRYMQVASESDTPRAEFWLAQALASQGDFFGQAQHLEAASEAGPLTYYGLRARAILDQEVLLEEPPAVNVSPPDWAALEEWLAASYGPEDPLEWQTFTASASWRRGLELLNAALFSIASNEIAPLADAAPSPWVRYRIARAMYEAGRIRLAARAVEPLAAAGANSPPELQTLVYPARFSAQANAAAAVEQVSPFLLLALVRQESFFDESAVSSAGALGLTQVIPATAADIAADLGDADFKEGDLLHPEISLRFGAHYLAAQIEGFGGNLHAALAAYNGGPGNAGRWADASGGDPDLLLESIDFPETRLYVEVVLRNYALYRYTYGGADRLSLPLP